MVWVRIDEAMPEHPKFAAAGPLGLAMQVAALGYCNRQHTDGFLPSGQVNRLLDLEGIAWVTEGGSEPVTARQIAERLEGTCVWERVDGGYRIHDFDRYQPTRAQVEEADKAQAEGRNRGFRRVARDDGGRFAKAAGRTASHRLTTATGPGPETETETETETDTDTETEGQELEPRVARRARDPLFDALARIEGSDPSELTRRAGKAVATALAEIRRATPELTPAEIERRATNYAGVMPPGTTLTASALAKHWSRCGGAMGMGPTDRASHLIRGAIARQEVERGAVAGDGVGGDLAGGLALP